MSRKGRVLVAGVGNVFRGDDGFGVEVVNRIDPRQLPAGVDIADYGVRGVHLTHDLLSGDYHTLVLVDTLRAGAAPGTVSVAEVAPAAGTVPEPLPGGGSLDLAAVLDLLATIGAALPRVVLVGCVPAVLEGRMGLSDPVAAAVPDGARLAVDLARAALGDCRGCGEVVADA